MNQSAAFFRDISSKILKGLLFNCKCHIKNRITSLKMCAEIGKLPKRFKGMQPWSLEMVNNCLPLFIIHRAYLLRSFDCSRATGEPLSPVLYTRSKADQLSFFWENERHICLSKGTSRFLTNFLWSSKMKPFYVLSERSFLLIIFLVQRPPVSDLRS